MPTNRPSETTFSVQTARDEPEVSVLIAVHNGVPYVESAIRSIMQQTLRDIEIIVVDDASQDETASILARLAAEDPRLRIATLAENQRLPRALNHGLSLARAPLVARMDADDIADSNRLEIQKRYLDAHPGVILLGASIRQIDEEGTPKRISTRPRDAVCCRWFTRFGPPLMHPTWMFRNPDRLGLALHYDSDFTVTEDYDLLARLLQHGEVVNLGRVLLDYRVHASSITGKNWKLQGKQAGEIALRHSQLDMSQGVNHSLQPFRNAYFLQSYPRGADIFPGLRQMLAEDIAKTPSHASWLRRQTAQIALIAMQRCGLSKHRIAGEFLTKGPDFLPGLVLRILEIKRLLPGGLRSDPDLHDATP
jgi:glycosyltransferase involved in cell wall biosynthesis